MAGRFSVPLLQVRQGMGGECHFVAVLAVRSSNFGNGGNLISGYGEAFADVVPSHVVRDEPEERSQRAGLAESAWSG